MKRPTFIELENALLKAYDKKIAYHNGHYYNCIDGKFIDFERQPT